MQQARKLAGRRITDARERSGFSVQDLARLLDLAPRELRRLEAGQAALSFSLARRIGDTLNLSPAALLHAEPGSQRSSDNPSDNNDTSGWTTRVAQAILDEGSYLTPPRALEVSSKLIAYFAARPELQFEVEVYEERVRALQARASLMATASASDDG